MNTENLLVELFVEELPPKALPTLERAFAQSLFTGLHELGLTHDSSVATAYATPRRLAVHITQVKSQAADKTIAQKLMPVTVGLDANGKPTPALLKKLTALGLDESAVSMLEQAPDGKATALFIQITSAGANLQAGLQTALDNTITKLPIPKVMSYQLADGWSSVNFVRPVHRLVALHGATVLPVTTLGITADRLTQGHRFEGPAEPLSIGHADQYETQLRAAHVIASFTQRRTSIDDQLQAAATKVGAGLKPIDAPELLDEVTALVEHPNVLTCQFESEFLQVPQECLILTMKVNQKYFPLLDTAGKLTNKFLIVSNITPADPSRVIAGNERVVRPRLADAKFFFDQDRKKTLASRLPALDKVVYHNKLGSQGERMRRVQAIAAALAKQVDASLTISVELAAQLAKADLLTDMVGEFPELQGIMGRYYAQHEGQAVEVAQAIEDHYKPRFAGDDLPAHRVGQILALADKLETLMGLFSIGQIPSGDKDPFALRRHALGVLRLLSEGQLNLSMDSALQAAAAPFNADAAVQTQVSDFIFERATGYCKDMGYSTLVVDAVLSLRPQQLVQLKARLQAADAFNGLEQAPALAAANKRIGNILKKSQDAIPAQDDRALMQAGAETDLFDQMQSPLAQSAQHVTAQEFTQALQCLAPLKNAVDAYFDHVMVNAPEDKIRLNRLAMLKRLHTAMNQVADLSKLAA